MAIIITFFKKFVALHCFTKAFNGDKDMHISERIQQILTSLPEKVRLIAVSKFQAIEKLQEAYQGGQRHFGESRALEMRDKHAQLPQDICWHFIGHLQKNKIKYIAPFVHLIHAVDSAELLAEINKEAAKNGRVIDCLLQIHIAREEHKFGFSVEECLSYLDGGAWKNLNNIRIVGLMGMATFTDDEQEIRLEFKTLKDCFEQAKCRYFAEDTSFCELSIGMSDDYPIALEYGSTLVRIGTAIFGERQ